MPGPPQRPNHALQAAIAEVGLSHRQLAQWVRAIGRRRRTPVGTSHSAIARYVAGSQPHWPVPLLLAEALSLKLGYDLGVADLSLPDSRPPTQATTNDLEVCWQLDDAAQALELLTDRDMNRRNFLTRTAFVAGAFAQPALFWSTSQEADPRAHSGVVRVGMEDVQRIRRQTAAFRQLDYEIGGQETRALVVQYLNGVVSTKLRGTYSERVGTALLGAVAELAEHAGWASFDSGRDALAQRYFIHALRFSQAGGDNGYGALVLADMACQSAHLRHGREAVNLARAGLQHNHARAYSKVAAVLHVMEARGHAVLRDEKACSLSLRQAESALERATPGSDPDWIVFFEPTLAHWIAQCHLDLRQPKVAQRFAEEALALRPPGGDLCRRVQETSFLALGHLQSGDVDAACADALQALGDARQVSSPHTLSFLQDFRRRVAGQYGDLASVKNFEEQARTVLGQHDPGRSHDQEGIA